MRVRRRYLALLGGLTALAGLAFAAPAANAVTLPLPVCANTASGTVGAGLLAPATNQPGLPPHCWYLPSGDGVHTGEAAGYLAADDGHTRYRFIQTNFKVSGQFANLDGASLDGGVGVEECDPNISYAVQFGVVRDSVTHAETPFVAQGHWKPGAGDPCINNTPLVPNPNTTLCPPGAGAGSVLGVSGTVNPPWCASFAAVNVGDQLNDFAIYYTPGGSHFHHVSFGFCDTTAGVCRQVYAPLSVNLNFWELGAGVFSGAQTLTAPPNITVVSFTSTSMNCYSCKAAFRPLSVIQPVNSNGVGGITGVQDVNVSGQAVLGPNNSLDTGGNFTVYNGSTSS